MLAGLLFFKACFISVLWFVTLVGLDTSSRFFFCGGGGGGDGGQEYSF